MSFDVGTWASAHLEDLHKRRGPAANPSGILGATVIGALDSSSFPHLPIFPQSSFPLSPSLFQGPLNILDHQPQ